MQRKRTRLLGALTLIVLLRGAQPAFGAVVVIDTFLEPFNLSARGLPEQVDLITSDLVTVRAAAGAGNTEWYGVIEPGSGIFRYTVDVRVAPSRRDSFAFSYYRPLHQLNLLGYSAFRLGIIDVVGAGHLQVSIDGQDRERSQSLAITGPGQYLYPFSNIMTGQPFDQLGSIDFWLVPDTIDFSVAISEIAVVPEPGTGLLMAIPLLGLLLRRTRHPASRFQ